MGSRELGKSFFPASTSRHYASRVGFSSSPLLPFHGYVKNRPPAALARVLELPSPSFGYGIQFTRCLPSFRGILFKSVTDKDAPVLHAEIAVLFAKDMIEPVSPAEMKSGVYSPYFIAPKKRSGLHPILDLQGLIGLFTDP